MKRSVVKWPRVEEDLTEYYSLIAQDKIEPAEKLLVVARESFDLLARHPSVGLPWKSGRRKLQGIYCYPMPAPYRNYLIFYLVGRDRIEIIAVLQGAQNLERAMSDIVE